ncbi:MAG: histidinol phosphatase [Chloroflexi bacterium]|nr:histidinol phosphatase [Chloroflexota bacterium]
MSRAASAAFGPRWSASLQRGTDAELRGWVEAALRWCDAADEIALRYFREAPVTTRKPDRTFVTEADTAIERLIRDRIAAELPAHGVVGEEYGNDAGGASVRWYVDPIDGTHNYLRGIPIFATLLGVERDGELQAGIISAPAMGVRWYAWRGGGAWATGLSGGSADPRTPRRLRATEIASLDEAQLVYAGPRDLVATGRAPGFSKLVDTTWRERGFGEFWGYGLVAEGAAEIMIECGLKMWDVAAPAVIVEEAGGRITDLDGTRDLGSGTTLATNGVLHDAVLRIVADREGPTG